MTRQFNAVPAERQNMPLFIGIVGPSSSGKTRSAFELAAGISEVDPGPIAFINTEGKRGLLDVNLFKNPDGSPLITHVPFEAPYRSLDYLDAINYARETIGAKTIIIDSLSHEHEADGGMLDFQDQEVKRLAGDDYGTWKAERFNMLAWQAPKAARRKLLTRGIMQTDCNIIACFRAKETSKPVKIDGKIKVVQMGFTPIAGDEFVFEMALSCLLLPGAEGVPTWESDNVGERLAMKRNGQLTDIVPNGARLSREMGRELAKWAHGLSEVTDTSAVDVYRSTLAEQLGIADNASMLGSWWNSPEQKDERKKIGIPPETLREMQAAVKGRIEEIKAKEMAG